MRRVPQHRVRVAASQALLGSLQLSAELTLGDLVRAVREELDFSASAICRGTEHSGMQAPPPPEPRSPAAVCPSA